MADVELGFVHEFGANEEFTAKRGEGAWLGETKLELEGPGYGLEVVGLESAEPARIAPVVSELAGQAVPGPGDRIDRDHARLRRRGAPRRHALGASVPLGRRGCCPASRHRGRGAVEFAGFDLDDADLGLDARYAVLAARNTELLAKVRSAQEQSPDV